MDIKPYIIILPILLLSCWSQAQSLETKQILKSDFFKENCININDSICLDYGNTNSFSTKICKCLEFLSVDSLLYQKEQKMIKILESNEVDIKAWEKNSVEWYKNRRTHSDLVSDEFSNHHRMIIYFESLILLSKERIKYLDFLTTIFTN